MKDGPTHVGSIGRSARVLGHRDRHDQKAWERTTAARRRRLLRSGGGNLRRQASSVAGAVAEDLARALIRSTPTHCSRAGPDGAFFLFFL